MRAADDLEDVAEHIALDKREAAARFVAQLLHEVESLAEFPLLGRLVPELRGQRYRELIVTPCRVIYTPEKGSITIQRVIRGEMHMHAGLIPPDPHGLT